MKSLIPWCDSDVIRSVEMEGVLRSVPYGSATRRKGSKDVGNVLNFKPAETRFYKRIPWECSYQKPQYSEEKGQKAFINGNDSGTLHQKSK